MIKGLSLALLALTVSLTAQTGEPVLPPPLRLAVVGLTHGHVDRFIGAVLARGDVKLVGIVESDAALVTRAAAKRNLPKNMFFNRLEDLLDRGEVKAVAVFTNTFEHRRVVELCAARGVHVMMEKPLAVNMEHARAIQSAAKESGIHVLVNYEPIWSPAYQQAFALVHNRHSIGAVRKLIAHDGNNGPIANRAPVEFVQWLIDPKLNGGGALNDFGCYGAAVLSWMLDNRRPVSVMASLQNFKPSDYPAVEDEATVVVTYPDTVGIIMGSWNWPYARKDFEVYGTEGSLVARFRNDIQIRIKNQKEQKLDVSTSPAPWTDSISYFRAVVSGQVQPSGPPALETNLIVTEILDSARESARTGKLVTLP